MSEEAAQIENQLRKITHSFHTIITSLDLVKDKQLKRVTEFVREA